MNEADPLFTVVIPVFNDAARVGRAIGSVLTQTMGDFELIVIDDCSTDGSADVAEQFNDPRLLVVRNGSNLGCGGNKNKGLKLARGSLFKALDADDWLEPTCLEKALSAFTMHPSVALVTNAAREHLEGGDGTTRLRENRGPDGRFGIHEGVAFQEHYFRGKSAGNPTQVTLRTDWARAVGGWDARLVNGDEGALWLRIVRGRQALFLPEPLVHITLHPGSVTSQATRTGLEVRHIAQMFKDVVVDLPELDSARNRFWLVWTRGYQWFSRGQKLFCKRQFADAFGCWSEIAHFAPSLWWVLPFLGRTSLRAAVKIAGRLPFGHPTKPSLRATG